MLYNVLLIVQIVVSIAIIALVLMQHGKGADAGAAFGSGASGSVFGSSGSGNFLSRMTAVLATVFFLNSLGLAWLVSDRSPAGPGSIVDTVETSAPEAPALSTEVPTLPGETPVVNAAGDAAAVSEAASEAAQSEVPEVPSLPTASEAAPAPAATSEEGAKQE